MFLESKNNRDAIGIDSCERAVVFSALMLRYGYLQLDNQQKNSFQVKPTLKRISGGYESVVQLNCFLYVDDDSLLSGGDMLSSIVALYTGTNLYSGRNLLASETILVPIPEDIPELDSLEKYFYRNIQLLLESDIDAYYRNFIILPDFKGTDNLQRVKITGEILFNPNQYFLSNNLIEAVGIDVPNTDTPIEPQPNNSIFGNDFQLNNATVVGN